MNAKGLQDIRGWQWATVPVDVVALLGAFLAVPMVHDMSGYVRYRAVSFGSNNVAEGLARQIGRMAPVVTVITLVGWLGFAVMRSHMDPTERWVSLISLAFSLGAVITWAMM